MEPSNPSKPKVRPWVPLYDFPDPDGIDSDAEAIGRSFVSGTPEFEAVMAQVPPVTPEQRAEWRRMTRERKKRELAKKKNSQDE